MVSQPSQRGEDKLTNKAQLPKESLAFLIIPGVTMAKDVRKPTQ